MHLQADMQSMQARSCGHGFVGRVDSRLAGTSICEKSIFVMFSQMDFLDRHGRSWRIMFDMVGHGGTAVEEKKFFLVG
jgi:hypothetical protein